MINAVLFGGRSGRALAAEQVTEHFVRIWNGEGASFSRHRQVGTIVIRGQRDLM
jgi:hypothetical protein